MTVPSEIYAVIAQGNGTNFQFGYTDLEVYSNAELLVLKIDAAEAITILAEGTGPTNYSVTPAAPYSEGKTDGFITYPADSSVALPVGEKLYIVRVPALTQSTVLRNLGVQLPKNMETVTDKLVHMILFLKERLDRALVVERGQDVSATDVNDLIAQIVALDSEIDNLFVNDIITEAGTTRTLGLADKSKWIRCTNAAGCTITLPSDSIAFPIGTVVFFEQLDAATKITFVAGAGATMLKAVTHNAKTNTQYAVAQVKKVAADTWNLFGNLEPV